MPLTTQGSGSQPFSPNSAARRTSRQMADEEQRLTRPQRVSRPSKRARDGQANGRAATQDERSVRMFEADAVITTLHELCLIPASSRPDRRSIALAVAALRKELQGSATEQGQFYGLQVNTIRNVMTDWVEDVDARLEQALRYRALPADERATFSVSRPSEAELAVRESNKRAGDAWIPGYFGIL